MCEFAPGAETFQDCMHQENRLSSSLSCIRNLSGLHCIFHLSSLIQIPVSVDINQERNTTIFAGPLLNLTHLFCSVFNMIQLARLRKLRKSAWRKFPLFTAPTRKIPKKAFFSRRFLPQVGHLENKMRRVYTHDARQISFSLMLFNVFFPQIKVQLKKHVRVPEFLRILLFLLYSNLVSFFSCGKVASWCFYP